MSNKLTKPTTETAAPAPAPWWQTILASLANIAVAALMNHYVGPAAGVASAAAGTAAAHLARSPLDK